MIAAIRNLFHTRPRLLICGLIGILASCISPSSLHLHDITRMIIGWNIGAILYLLVSARMMFWSTHARMKTRALQQNDSRLVVLGMVVVAAFMSIGAIVAELSIVKDLTGVTRYAHLGLAVLTIATSWMFTQTMFAQHYAHDYYAAEQRQRPPGISFPGGHAPDYGDFLYFACVIGTSGQTADVSFTGRSVRRIGLIHCVLAFFFNTTLLALTINIASGLF